MRMHEMTSMGPGGYEIERDGTVRNKRTGRILKPFVGDRSGHLRVTIGGKHHYIHRLVAEVYMGACPPGMEVRHLDGNPANNNVSNLAYGTRSENVLDSVAHGTYRSANAAKTECPRGHAYDEANTYVDPSGSRRCRSCKRSRK